MKTKPAYLVIDMAGRQPTIARVRQSWPTLEPFQIIVRLALEIPDDLIPQAQTVAITAPEELVAVEALPVEPPADEEE